MTRSLADISSRGPCVVESGRRTYLSQRDIKLNLCHRIVTCYRLNHLGSTVLAAVSFLLTRTKRGTKRCFVSRPARPVKARPANKRSFNTYAKIVVRSFALALLIATTIASWAQSPPHQHPATTVIDGAVNPNLIPALPLHGFNETKSRTS